MLSPRTGSPRRPNRRRLTLLAGAAVIGLVPATGCQVEYAGMTLPSGKYMRDDVQYFAPGPDFPWANTQAATQRARMSAMGMVAPPTPGAGAIAPGGFSPNALGAPIPAIPASVAPGGAPAGAGPLGGPAAVPNPNPIAPGGAPRPGAPPSRPGPPPARRPRAGRGGPGRSRPGQRPPADVTTGQGPSTTTPSRPPAAEPSARGRVVFQWTSDPLRP